MNIYPKVQPIVLYNAPTMYGGVWHIVNKSSDHFLLYFNDFDKNKVLDHKFATLTEAITSMQSIQREISGFTYFTLYNTDVLTTEELLDLLGKISQRS